MAEQRRADCRQVTQVDNVRPPLAQPRCYTEGVGLDVSMRISVASGMNYPENKMPREQIQCVSGTKCFGDEKFTNPHFSTGISVFMCAKTFVASNDQWHENTVAMVHILHWQIRGASHVFLVADSICHHVLTHTLTVFKFLISVAVGSTQCSDSTLSQYCS